MQKEVHAITVEHFFNRYQEKLELELLTPEGFGMHRLIKEGSINRPALALTGFFKYFANKRIQVLGAAAVAQHPAEFPIALGIVHQPFELLPAHAEATPGVDSHCRREGIQASSS